MKIRNKKTGEIGNLKSFSNDKRVCIWVHKETDLDYIYNTLAELNEEWEDYKEPTTYWYFTGRGEVNCIEDDDNYFDKDHKAFGNYFESKEEAEKAVEKLKAWKRLKNAKFGIDEWRYRPIEVYSAIERDYKTISVHGEIKFSIFGYEDFVDDFKLLFGSEDE